MSYFKAKMHQIRFRLGDLPQTSLGELTALLQTPGFKGSYFLGKGRGGSRKKYLGGGLAPRPVCRNVV